MDKSKKKRHDMGEMEFVAQLMVSEGKGILAADWSLGTSEKHFKKNNIEHTEETRRKYRQMLFAATSLDDYISGVILFDETTRQKTDDGTPIPHYLENKGIVPGVKVDGGTVDMANFPGEKITQGLDGLRERLVEYKDLGIKFTKWRAVITIGDGIPTDQCIRTNAEILARYAALSQEVNLVPVVEPEVLMEGSHDIGRDEVTTRKTLTAVFSALEKHKVDIKGTILKTNFVHPGKSSKEEINHKLIAEETFQTLERTLPPELPGVVFLSGGDSPVEATAHLDALSKVVNSDKVDAPWEVSFSFARALQYPAIEVWAGKDENIEKVQEVFLKRVKLTALARKGEYDSSMEESK